jgi:clan AA aspartic protease
MYTMEMNDMEKTNMGMVYADIVLKNAVDVGNVQNGLITEEKVRETTVRALVDTGAGTLIITEAIRKKLGLVVEGLRQATLANDQKEICQRTGPVEIHWKDRSSVCRALAVPGEGEILLGAIPLEDMDLIVNPKKQELIGAHGDEILTYLK